MPPGERATDRWTNISWQTESAWNRFCPSSCLKTLQSTPFRCVNSRCYLTSVSSANTISVAILELFSEWNLDRFSNICHLLSLQFTSLPCLVCFQCPLSPQEHHTLPLGTSVPVVVYEREPSSIISYALSCHDYRAGLEEMKAKRASVSEQLTPRYR